MNKARRVPVARLSVENVELPVRKGGCRQIDPKTLKLQPEVDSSALLSPTVVTLCLQNVHRQH